MRKDAEADAIHLDNMPSLVTDLKEWFETLRTKVARASRNPERAFKWILQVGKAKDWIDLEDD